jgi:hypothetical protein
LSSPNSTDAIGGQIPGIIIQHTWKK